jgi:hypothetical protein
MPQYGVWIEKHEIDTGGAMPLHPGETPPDLPEPEVIQFVWRGTAKDEDEAMEAARSAWEARYGIPTRGCTRYIIEIAPGDVGYAD